MIFGNLDYEDFFFLKMNEAWVNAPSLENDLINFFKNNDASDDF